MPVPTSITDLSTAAASNSPAGSDSIGNPGKIDDYFRGYGAVQRAESLNKSWERWNDTPTYISATQFSVAGNLTARYVVGRRVKCTVTAGTVYGRISVSAFTTLTTVTVVLDSGSLDSGLSEVQLGPETYGLFTNGASFVIGVATRVNGINTGTLDAADNKILQVAGGGAASSTRGAYINLSGNEDSGTGIAEIHAGNVTGGVFSVWTGNDVQQLTVTQDGRLYGANLHNNSGAVTGTVNQYIASGTYTPTLTNVATIASSSASGVASQWIRVGNVVTVSGTVLVRPSGAGTVQLGVSYPIASTTSTSGQCAGTGYYYPGTGDKPCAVRTDIVNNRAEIMFIAAGDPAANVALHFQFTYVVA